MKSTNYINEIRQQLDKYISNPGTETEKISMSAAARGSGVSATAISQFLGNKYPGDNSTLAKKIGGWLQRQRERQAYEEVFDKPIGTDAVTRLLQTARICHIQREIGVATGPAGAGKTTGSKLYAKQNSDVIFIEVLPYYTAKYIISDIHKKVGFNGQGTLIDMANDVIDKLKDSGRMIIIDEAEHLPYKALELIRRLYDLAGIGILLVGMPQLITNLKGSQGQYKQLYSRIGVHTIVTDLESEDMKKLVGAALPGSNGIWKHFERHTTNARALSKLLKQSIQIASSSNSPVTPDMITEAKQYIII